MLKKLFSPEYLLEKVIGLVGTLILALILLLRHPIVSILSKAPSELLAEIILLILAIAILIIVALIISLSIFNSQHKPKYEFVSYYGAKWRIDRIKKSVYRKPFCICPDHEPIECKFVKYDGKYRFLCPTKAQNDYNVIKLIDPAGQELTLEQAVELVGQSEFGR